MARIVLGSIGLSKKYQEVNYFGRRKIKHTGQNISSSCSQFIPARQILCFLHSTDSQWGVINELKNCLGDVVKEVPIPEGRSEEELWQIFDICVAQVAEGDQIILDVTHGFRSLPMLIFVVAAYLRQMKHVVLERVVYGAYEAKDENYNAPVFDLTLMVELMDWFHGLDSFSRHGDAGLLKELMARAHDKGRLYGSGEEGPKLLKKAARRLDQLSLALHLSRPLEAIKVANQLVKTLDGMEEEVARWAKPLQGVIGQLRWEVASLVCSEPHKLSKEVLKSQAALMKYCIEKGLYVQALLLIPEWIISLVMFLRGNTDNVINDDRRKETRCLLNAFLYDDFSEVDQELCQWFLELPSRKDIVFNWESVTTRNVLAHCGFRKHSIKARRTKDTIKKLYNNLTDLLYLLEEE